ncbi:hypothetical protein YC2023_088130 [Brassica napus]
MNILNNVNYSWCLTYENNDDDKKMSLIQFEPAGASHDGLNLISNFSIYYLQDYSISANRFCYFFQYTHHGRDYQWEYEESIERSIKDIHIESANICHLFSPTTQLFLTHPRILSEIKGKVLSTNRDREIIKTKVVSNTKNLYGGVPTFMLRSRPTCSTNWSRLSSTRASDASSLSMAMNLISTTLALITDSKWTAKSVLAQGLN